jgi:hypothetical protein
LNESHQRHDQDSILSQYDRGDSKAWIRISNEETNTENKLKLQDLEPVPIYCSSNVRTHLNDVVEIDSVLAATRASHLVDKSEINLKT